MRRLNIHSNVTGRQVSYSASPPKPPPPDTPSALRPYSTQLHSSPPPPLPTSAPAPLPHIFSLLFNCERVGRTLKLARCHSQVLSDEIQVDNCGCACFHPIGGESWRPTMYFCTSSLLCLMISVNSPKWQSQEKMFFASVCRHSSTPPASKYQLNHAYMYLRVQVQRKNPK